MIGDEDGEGRASILMLILRAIGKIVKDIAVRVFRYAENY